MSEILIPKKHIEFSGGQIKRLERQGIVLEKGVVLSVLNGICQFYLTITRGTPVVVQIMIIYFVIHKTDFLYHNRVFPAS